MAGFVLAALGAALTVNGTATGYARVASINGFRAGAKLFISSSTQPSQEVTIVEITGTDLGLRFTSSLSYGRSDLSAYLVADAARVDMSAQMVYDIDAGDALTGNPATITGLQADGASALGIVLDTVNAFVTAGSKLVSIRSGAAEKAYFDKDGVYNFLGNQYAIQLRSTSATTEYNGIRWYATNGTSRWSLGNDWYSNNGHDWWLYDNVNARAYIYITPGGGSYFRVAPKGGVEGDAADTIYLYTNNIRRVTITTAGKISLNATDASGTPGAATINNPSGQVAVALGASSVVVTNSLVTTSSVVWATLQDVTDNIQIKGVVPAAGSFTIHLTGTTSAARKVGFVVFN